MIDWMDLDDLFCDEYNSLCLHEYVHEIHLLKELIIISEYYVTENVENNIGSFKGVCSLFAKSIVQYAKSAYDNFLIGHFDVAYSICRIIVENNVCLKAIVKYKSEELWKYYLIHSYHHTWRFKRNSDYSNLLKDIFHELCKTYEIDSIFLNKREVDGKQYRPYIEEPYGWSYKVNKKFTFSSLCNLVDEEVYMDFKLTSEFSHGTSTIDKVISGNYSERIMNIISLLYIELRKMLLLLYSYKLDEDYFVIDDEFTDIFDNYLNNKDIYSQ